MTEQPGKSKEQEVARRYSWTFNYSEVCGKDIEDTWLAGFQYALQQRDGFAVDAIKWITQYWGKANDGNWYSLDDALNEEPLTVEDLLNEYKFHLTLLPEPPKD